MKLGLAVTSLAVLTALTVPAEAQAPGPAIVTDKACYQEQEPIRVIAGPFTPNSTVTIFRDGTSLGTVPSGTAGEIKAELHAPLIDPSKERAFTLGAADQATPPRAVQKTLTATQLDVTVKPTSGSPAVKRKITARGFNVSGAKRLYAHVVKGKSKKTVKVAKLKQPCGKGKGKKRIFARHAKNGLYRVQFDVKRKYRKKTIPRVTFKVRIFTIFRPRHSSAASSVGERWARLD